MPRTSARRLRPVPVWLGRLERELRRLARPLLAGRLDGLLSLTFDIPLEPLPAPSAQPGHWCHWQRPDEGQILLALGHALRIEERGRERLSRLGRRWRQLQASWVHLNQGSATPGPRAHAGFAFDPDEEMAGPWQSFPNAVLVVPRLLLEWRQGHCILTFSHHCRPDDRPGQVIHGWISLLNGLLADCANALAAEVAAPHTEEERPSPARWQEQVADAVAAMREGPLQKVVLAREIGLSFGADLDHRRLLARLQADYPGCTLFAARFSGDTLVGATPERLLSVRQGRVVSDALAGTLEAGRRQGGEAMVRHEHQPVVKAILEALEPWCEGLRAGERPVPLRLQKLSHLHTRVEGRLKEETDPFVLLESLHPTPAVGGLPRGAALQWIRHREPIRRGWYTGALGWLGNGGEAEFSVILRCGLLFGRRARLYAGAGITEVSDPALELAETRLKLAVLLDRLVP